MAIESMAMGDAGATAIVMVGEVCGRRRRASMSYSYVDLRREAIFESVPARTDLAGFLLHVLIFFSSYSAFRHERVVLWQCVQPVQQQQHIKIQEEVNANIQSECKVKPVRSSCSTQEPVLDTNIVATSAWQPVSYLGTS